MIPHLTKIIKITNEDLVNFFGMPKIILINPFGYNSHSPAPLRRYIEDVILNDMLRAIENIISKEHIVRRYKNDIYLDDKKVFSYHESARHIYISQNMKYVKQAIDKEKIKGFEKYIMLKIMEESIK